MPTAKQPQDRKPKATAAERMVDASRTPVVKANGHSRTYAFQVDGKHYELPPGDTAVKLVSGRFLRDAIVDGEEGQLRLGFALLEKVDAAPGTLDALYSLNGADMMEHLRAWMTFRADENDAGLGESQP